MIYLSKFTLSIILIIIVGFSVYFFSLFNDGVWDDELQLVINPQVHSIKNIPQLFTGSTFYSGGQEKSIGIYFKPLMPTVFAVIYNIFGPYPFYFHLFQVCLHIINSILVFLFFNRLITKKFSLFIGFIFLVHPINVETVAYISALQDVLFFFFGMLGLLIVSKKTVKKPASTIEKLVYPFLFLILITASLFSKESGLLFLIISLVYLFLFKKKYFLFYLASAGSSIGIYFWMRFFVAKIGIIEASNTLFAGVSLPIKLLNLPEIIYFYLKGYFYPVTYAIAQDWIIKNPTFNNFYLPLLICFALITFLIIIFFRIRRITPQRLELYYFFLIWFLLGLVFHSQIIALDLTASDRWFYFTQIGLMGILVLALQSFKIPKYLTPRVILIISIVIINALAWRTFIRTFDWKNDLTLITKDIKTNPDSYYLNSNLGIQMIYQLKFEQSKAYLNKAIDLNPFLPSPYASLASVYESEGNREKAIEYHSKAIEHDQAYYYSYQALSYLLIDPDSPNHEGYELIKKSTEFFPKNDFLWHNLAVFQLDLGLKNEAKASAEKALSLNPENENNKSLIEKIKFKKTVTADDLRRNYK